jgi:SIR2-like domain
MIRRTDGTLLKRLRDFLTGCLIELVWREPTQQLSYLEPMITVGAGSGITVATLNCGNTIEIKALKQSVPCNTGIQDWIKSGTVPCYPSGIELIKLHGSANWSWKTEPASGVQHRTLVELNEDELAEFVNQAKSGWGDSGQQLGVIFGGRNKLTAEGPFLDLLMKFRTAVSNTKKLVVIGYPFRDDHINHLIRSWLRGRKMVVIDRPDKRREEIEFLNIRWPKFQDRIEYLAVGAEEGIATQFATS